MRIYSKTLTIGGVLALAVLGGGNSVSAASTCPIGYTGPDSTNICTSVQTYACTVNNTNQVTISGQNAQGSVSGNAAGGGTQTGTATNSNGAVFNVSVTNQGVCSAVQTTPGTTVADVPPAASSTSRPQVVAGAVTPTALANTGNEMTAWLPFIGLGVVAAGAMAIRYIVAANK